MSEATIAIQKANKMPKSKEDNRGEIFQLIIGLEVKIMKAEARRESSIHYTKDMEMVKSEHTELKISKLGLQRDRQNTLKTEDTEFKPRECPEQRK